MTWFGFGVADGLDLEIHPGELKFVIPCIASDSFFFFFFFTIYTLIRSQASKKSHSMLVMVSQVTLRIYRFASVF
jgi:hypothetical protein